MGFSYEFNDYTNKFAINHFLRIFDLIKGNLTSHLDILHSKSDVLVAKDQGTGTSVGVGWHQRSRRASSNHRQSHQTPVVGDVYVNQRPVSAGSVHFHCGSHDSQLRSN